MAEVGTVAQRSQVVATRRGYALLGLGLVVPGSAQAIHGRRGLGRVALGLWMVLVLAVILAVILTLIFRDAMIGFFGNGVVLKVLAVVVFAVGFFWTGLTLNTAWTARPARMGAKKGAIFFCVAIVLAVALCLGTVWVGRAVWATGGALGNIFHGGGVVEQSKGRYNILLLGSDAGPDRWGTRPDSINVVSVDADTGHSVIIGLPRNLESVPFPETSPLHALYPNGLVCETEEAEIEGTCLINAVYVLGLENAALYPGVADPGVQAMIDAVSGVTGLDINYFAMIDMQGFIDLIDAMGGLTITINQRVVLNSEDNVFIDPAVDRVLSGYEALWFARARAETSDYDRMQRQKCVLTAILHELDPGTVVSQFTDLAAASGDTIKTSVPSSQIGELATLALKARDYPVVTLSFVPPLIDPANPDFAFIQQTVDSLIAQSEAVTPAPDPSATATPTEQAPPPSENPSAEPSGSAAPPAVPDDLSPICSVG